MQHSESIKNITKALVQFNSEVTKISKDANNPFHKSNYATLDNIVDVIRPILTKNGLFVQQDPSGDGEVITVTTLIFHDSGEWMKSASLPLKPVKNDPQSYGSCITYGRRYGLQAFLSLNTGEDDDGNQATFNQQPQQRQQTQKKQTQKQTNNKAPNNITDILKKTWSELAGDLNGFDEWYKKKQVEGITELQMKGVLDSKLKLKQSAVTV